MSSASLLGVQFTPYPLPLCMDEHGAIRVGNSRITLEIIIEDFESGSSPENIVANYDTLDRGDVYAVLGYYLHHRPEVQAYFGTT